MAITGITVSRNTIQVSYEGRNKEINDIRNAAKRNGMKYCSGSMGNQVTHVGVVRLNMLTIFHDGKADLLTEEIIACEKADVFDYTRPSGIRDI